jgi:hypothetical protein
MLSLVWLATGSHALSTVQLSSFLGMTALFMGRVMAWCR